jgi:hypothetical protein
MFTIKRISKERRARAAAEPPRPFSYPALAGLGISSTPTTATGTAASFRGEPERVYIPNDIGAFASELWEGLISRTRSRLHRTIDQKRLAWKNGCSINRQEAR